MAVIKKDEIDKLLEEERPGFWEGVPLLLGLVWRFLRSLSPKNWSLARIAESEKIIDPDQHKNYGIEERLEGEK